MPDRPFPLVLGLAVAVLLAGAGCGPPDASPPDPAARVTDDLGRSVEVARPARRVLALAPSLTEILYAVGAGDALAGASQADDYPAETAALPRYSTYPLDLEAVVALQPDLVLATDQINNPDDARPLAEAGIPTYFFSFDAVDDVPRVIRTVGTLVGAEAQADAAAADFERRLARLEARTAGLDRPRTLLLIGSESLFAFGDASYTQRLIALAGGESVTAGFEGEALTLSEEFVLEAAPEVIVVSAGDGFDAEAFVANRTSWSPVPAIAQGRVYGLDPDLLLRPGPRLVEGAESMARLLHPALETDESTTRGGDERQEAAGAQVPSAPRTSGSPATTP